MRNRVTKQHRELLGVVLRGNDGNDWRVYRAEGDWVYVGPAEGAFDLDDTRKVRIECVSGDLLRFPSE